MGVLRHPAPELGGCYEEKVGVVGGLVGTAWESGGGSGAQRSGQQKMFASKNSRAIVYGLPRRGARVAKGGRL